MGKTKIEVVKRDKLKGWELRKEIWTDELGVKHLKILGYTPSGQLIGNALVAKDLVETWGINPEKIGEEYYSCTIGFCAKENRWYGWSFNAICGFEVGDMLYDKDFGTDETSVIKHGSIKIETLEQAKQSAINFAEHMRTK